MKIVFLPGVGFHENQKKYTKFLEKLQKEVDFEYEFFNWDHDYHSEDHDSGHADYGNQLNYHKLRGWVVERLLDYQHVLFHANEMVIPEADVYLGHSAGSILAMAKAKGGKCILYGSPLSLVGHKEFSHEDFLYRCQCEETQALNIVHRNDVIAYPINHKHVENFYVGSNMFQASAYNPVTAHWVYWKSKATINKTITQLKEWGY